MHQHYNVPTRPQTHTEASIAALHHNLCAPACVHNMRTVTAYLFAAGLIEQHAPQQQLPCMPATKSCKPYLWIPAHSNVPARLPATHQPPYICLRMHTQHPLCRQLTCLPLVLLSSMHPSSSFQGLCHSSSSNRPKGLAGAAQPGTGSLGFTPGRTRCA
jgi:hypothetical protein